MRESTPAAALRRHEVPLEEELERFRTRLTGYCYRMLGSADAEDAVQETFLRAWRGRERFEGRAPLHAWLFRIATNVCLDMLDGRKRRALPVDLGPARAPEAANLTALPDSAWIEPMPDGRVSPEGDPADVAVARETLRLAFVAVLQTLPPRQRAALILCEVLRWTAEEAAGLLETTTASVNSALQRARATLREAAPAAADAARPDRPADPDLLDRYVEAFERYDMAALTELIREDATQSMPPYELWLSGRDDMLAWWVGPGRECRGSRVIPAGTANGLPAFGQYKPRPAGDGYDPWALQVVTFEQGRIADIVFFLDTPRLFPLFGLPPLLNADGSSPG